MKAPEIPPPPKIIPPPRMPDPEDPAVMEARKKAQQAIYSRTGRASTILT